LQNGTDLSRIVNSVFDFFLRVFRKNKSTTFKRVHVNPIKNNARRSEPARQSKIITKDKTQQQIDEILDKISKSGYDSLTSEEKQFLFKAGK